MNKYPIVSSNTLFHFTDKLKYLVSILENNFRPRIRKEEFGGLIPDHPTPALYAYVFPMTCFCDLPLSNTKKHLDEYGEYGIGLTKSWGMRKGLNPVLYVQKDANLWKDLYDSNIHIQHEILSDAHFNDGMIKGITTLQFFIKPYEGGFHHRGDYKENIRFYDEREWRFVPRLNYEEFEVTNIYDDPNLGTVSNPSYQYYNIDVRTFDAMNKKELNDLNNSLPSSATLEFTPDDIRYIIVKSDDDILTMMDEIQRLKGEKYDENQVRTLQTRIISAQQISEDF